MHEMGQNGRPHPGWRGRPVAALRAQTGGQWAASHRPWAGGAEV